MFRRLPASLPPDPTFPAKLEKLGFFVTENDQIRRIDNQSQKFQFKIDRNDRVNEMHREAMNSCVRGIVIERLHNLGLSELRVPLSAGPEDPHIPILISPDLSKKKHVIVLFTDRYNDPGILSYRTIGEEAINRGSLVDFAKAVLTDAQSPPGSLEETPGLIITNSAQTIWYRGGHRAVTHHEWHGLPRATAVTEPMRIDEEKNRIPGNKTFTDHVCYILEHVMSQHSTDGDTPLDPVCGPEARFSLIGMEYPISTALMHITSSAQWAIWKPRIICIAMLSPQHTLAELQAGKTIDVGNEIAEFIAKRSRTYFVSPGQKVETLMNAEKGMTLTLGCNCYASGESWYEENVLVRCWDSALRWIFTCAADPGYEEPRFELGEVPEAKATHEDGPKGRWT